MNEKFSVSYYHPENGTQGEIDYLRRKALFEIAPEIFENLSDQGLHSVSVTDSSDYYADMPYNSMTISIEKIETRETEKLISDVEASVIAIADNYSDGGDSDDMINLLSGLLKEVGSKKNINDLMAY